jgi:hypothetical protein
MLFDIQRPLGSLLGLLQLSAEIRWRTHLIESGPFSQIEYETHGDRVRLAGIHVNSEVIISLRSDWRDVSGPPVSEGEAVDFSRGCAVPIKLPPDVARHQIDREQVIDRFEPSVSLQLRPVGVGQVSAQRGQAVVGQLPVINECRVPHDDLIWEQLVLVDLDPEVALEAEDNVQEIDGLSAQIALQGRGRLDFLFFDAQRFHKHSRDPSVDFV